jgi:hypothetical protein
MDGQLDKVLTGHLRVIKQVLINEMESLYHSRELYPRDIIDVTETVIEKE